MRNWWSPGIELDFLAALVTKCFYYKSLASFPGPAQLSVLKVPESWAGLGNETNESLYATCMVCDSSAIDPECSLQVHTLSPDVDGAKPGAQHMAASTRSVLGPGGD